MIESLVFGASASGSRARCRKGGARVSGSCLVGGVTVLCIAGDVVVGFVAPPGEALKFRDWFFCKQRFG